MRICAATWPWVRPSSLRRARIMLAKSSVNRPSPGHPAACIGATTSPSPLLSKRRRSNHPPLSRPRTAAEVQRAFSAGLPRRHRLPQPSQREPCSLHAQPRQVHLRRHRLRSPPRAPLRRPLHRLSPTNELYRTNGLHLYSETTVIVKPLAKAIWTSTRARLRRAPAPPSLLSPAGSRMARAAARRRSARNVRAPRAPARDHPDVRPQPQTRPVHSRPPRRPRITRIQPPPPAPRTPAVALPHKASQTRLPRP